MPVKAEVTLPAEVGDGNDGLASPRGSARGRGARGGGRRGGRSSAAAKRERLDESEGASDSEKVRPWSTPWNLRERQCELRSPTDSILPDSAVPAHHRGVDMDQEIAFSKGGTTWCTCRLHLAQPCYGRAAKACIDSLQGCTPLRQMHCKARVGPSDT